MEKTLGIAFIILGIVLISTTIGIDIGLDKEKIKTSYKGCESILGGLAQDFSDKAEEECLEARNKMFLVNYSFLGYIFGVFFIIIGTLLIILKQNKKTRKK